MTNNINPTVDITRYTWTTDSREKFANMLQSTKLQTMITATVQQSPATSGTLLSAVNEIIQTAAKETLTSRPRRTQVKKTRFPVQKSGTMWTVETLRKILQNWERK
jgi:hypothetical protein